jgi:hypothetical protein
MLSPLTDLDLVLMALLWGREWTDLALRASSLLALDPDLEPDLPLL